MKRKRGGGLWVSSHGRIQNVDGLRYFPTVRAVGYSTVSIGKMNRYVHRIVQVLFNDPSLSNWFEGAEVDHINRTRSDNRASNLRWADRSLQNKNKGERVWSHYHLPAVLAWHVQTDVVTRHATTGEAAEHTGVHSTNISACCNGRQRSAKGYVFLHHVENDFIDGEEWRPIQHGHQVSSAGRIMTPLGVAYFPMAGEDGYRHVTICRVRHRVHTLVLSAWHERPSVQHTVDHKNQIKSDNRLENLRWATWQEQRANQTRKAERMTIAWEYRQVGDREWKLAESTYVACQKTGAKACHIASCARPNHRLKSTPGTGGVRYEFRKCKDASQEDIEGEVWKVVQASEWEEGGKYACVIGSNA